MDFNSIIRLYTPNEIHQFILGIWKTDLFRNLHQQGLGKPNFISQIVEDFAALPRFVFKMSDPKLEWAHFSTWWGGIPYREYENPYIHDLYWIHEMTHAGNMVHMKGMNLENFGRKMTDNELHASVVSEIQVYFEIPELRKLSFKHTIYADRFLHNGYFIARYKHNPRMAFEEMKVRRRNTMMDTTSFDIADKWINRFYMQNSAWIACWAHSFDEVETAMADMRDSSGNLSDLKMEQYRKTSLDIFIDTFLVKNTQNNIPFLREAEAFAGIYWANRSHYDQAMEESQKNEKD